MDKPNYPHGLALALPPEVWSVGLVTGESIQVLTHGFSIEDGRYVFSLLFKGSPNLDVPVLIIPADLIAPGQWP